MRTHHDDLKQNSLSWKLFFGFLLDYCLKQLMVSLISPTQRPNIERIISDHFVSDSGTVVDNKISSSLSFRCKDFLHSWHEVVDSFSLHKVVKSRQCC
jgi:hypothetical protein